MTNPNEFPPSGAQSHEETLISIGELSELIGRPAGWVRKKIVRELAENAVGEIFVRLFFGRSLSSRNVTLTKLGLIVAVGILAPQLGDTFVRRYRMVIAAKLLSREPTYGATIPLFPNDGVSAKQIFDLGETDVHEDILYLVRSFGALTMH